MSGHSKWSTIKRQKGLNDAKRGQIFTKLANAITIAVREGGGGDPASNIRLRLALEKARQVNMPKDNMEKAIDRGLGKLGENAIDVVSYEGFGPNGVAIMVEAITDNRNRTSAEMKSTFDKYGGTFAQPGTVRWQFDQLGMLTIPKDVHTIDDIMLLAIDGGAQDVQEDEDGIMVFTEAQKVHEMKTHLESLDIPIQDMAIILKPKELIAISPKDRDDLIAFLERVEDLADVQTVYTTADI